MEVYIWPIFCYTCQSCMLAKTWDNKVFGKAAYSLNEVVQMSRQTTGLTTKELEPIVWG